MVPEDRYPVRVRFSKVGSLKFISHLDLSRTMKAAFLRAKLPIWYTMGFNPHPKMVFSLPLSVGTASLCEFMDFMLTERVPCGEIVERLNAAFPAELRAIEAYEPTTKFCDVGWATYEIRIETPGASDKLAKDIRALFGGEIVISKTTKIGTFDLDIARFATFFVRVRRGRNSDRRAPFVRRKIVRQSRST
jgi:radical SAM-linked protein